MPKIFSFIAEEKHRHHTSNDLREKEYMNGFVQGTWTILIRVYFRSFGISYLRCGVIVAV